jgi:Protein of unknown function (DUF2950)
MTALHRVTALTLAAALLAVGMSSVPAAAQATAHRTFATADEAVQTLIDAAKGGHLEDLLAIFGPDGQALIDSVDPVTARQNRQVFVAAAAEKRQLVDDGANRKTLVLGYEEWPFPVPLVKDGKGWKFDTAAGKEEVIARRVGRNELAAIATCRAYVTAQVRYAQQAHDGKPAGLYAMTFRSDAGKENGLYWPAARGQKQSPLGDLVAAAAQEGRPLPTGPDQQRPAPLHGYYFKILSAQGAAAPGGAMNYVADGAMSRGFALVAWPAQYNVTGVMTFVVGHDGVVHEKDLGTDTDAAVAKMTAYNPDASWPVSR